MPRLILAGEALAFRRRVRFHVVGTDGISPALGEAGGQPQVSVNDAAFTNVGIGVLVSIGFGRYYAVLDPGSVANIGDAIETRYKGPSTAETPGESVQLVAYDPYDDILDIRQKTDLISSGQLSVVSPIAANGRLQLVHGDEYSVAGGDAIEWSDSSGRWPTLPFGTAIAFTLYHVPTGTVALTKAGILVAGTGSPKVVRLELTEAETGALQVGDVYRYDVQAILPGTITRTLVIGPCLVLADFTP